MIILSVDVSYCSLGYCLFNTENNKLTSHTMKFSSILSLTKKEKESYCTDEVLEKIDFVKERKKFIKESTSKSHKIAIENTIKPTESYLDDYWKNVRCSLFYKQLKSLAFDVMVVEKQFSVISDVFAVTRLASIHIIDPHIINSSMNSIKSFKSYYPTSWRKILFGSGNIGKSIDAKKFTKEKMNVILDNMGLNHKFNSGDEIDAFALLMTYLKENELVDNKIFENIKVGDK